MIRIGSRGSKLALWQANWVAARLKEMGENPSIKVIKTTGDRITDVALSEVGTKGLFTKEIEEALLDGSIDLAVHSLKDMPTDLPAGLTLAAIPEREDPRDAVVGAKLETLGRVAKVGTSSLRRAAQIRRARPDLVVEPVRGNVDTRLRKLDEGRYQALILAAAGLRRLGWEDRIVELLPPETMCPAVGQGALAIETRDEPGAVPELCRRLEHPETRAAVTAERAVLAELGGGCKTPIGAYGRVEGAELTLLAVVVSPNGVKSARLEAWGPAVEAEALGRQLGVDLLAAGAQEILEEIYGAA
ncbi:MAG: hydroxymethylbilane synthase [Bryobacteraceae bacterium]|nr:hydroxymethylbilane synthase [Bryobacteraceae bacterium]